MIKTIARVGYAPITERTASGYTYGNIVWFETDEAGGRNIESTPQGETFEIEADGVIVTQGEVNSGYQHSLELLDIIDDVRENWLGMIPTATGHFEKVDNKELPRFALVVANETFNGTKKYQVWTYFDSQVSERPTLTSKTMAKTFDPDFPTYTIASVPRISDKVIRAEDFVDTLPNAITEPTPVTPGP
jgi:hypothetical protein